MAHPTQSKSTQRENTQTTYN